MTRPALILVHPGSLAAHGSMQDLDAAVAEMECHDGPIVVIDGYLSDKTAPLDGRIKNALIRAEQAGYLAARLWGCDSGEPPFDQWKGFVSTGLEIEEVHSDQEVAAAKLAPALEDRDLILSGAWATYDRTSGCVISVGEALKETGWAGEYHLSDNVIYEEDMEG
jgi:hypothetical protein